MNTKFALIAFVFTVAFQGNLLSQTLVSGTVQELNGEPLGFVTIIEEGTTNGTTTDIQGNFSLSIQNPQNAVLNVSYVGYKSLLIPLEGRSSIDITMEEDIELLDEVVVVGYGSQKRSDVVGSVSTIKVEDAKRVPTSNVAELLRGKSAGVQVQLTDAAPGGESSILIRGKNSFEGGNAPLFIVDGAPSDNINDINAEDIESIEVLKDASAQAIYGARASNGVILITTKRGSVGKLKISYHGYRSEQQLTRNFDIFTGEEWVALNMEAFRSENNNEYVDSNTVFNATKMDLIRNGEYVNWEDEILQNASQQSHSLSLSGGTEKSSIYTSLSYFDQGGIIPGSGYKRGTARVNYDYKINNKISIGSNLSLSISKQDIRSGDANVTDQNADLISSAGLSYIGLPPLAKLYDEEGELIQFATGETNLTSPLWNLRESSNQFVQNAFSMTLFADYKLFKNFNYRLNTSLSRRNGQGNSYLTSLHASGQNTAGQANLSNQKRAEYLIENIFDYQLNINPNNKFDFTFVQSINERSYNFTKITGSGFTTDLLGFEGISSATDLQGIKRTSWDRRMLSFMGRVRYYLNDKYLLTLTGRRDGSSVFAPGNKWGFFPSAAVAWKAHLEPWFEKLDAINELKFRFSYGTIGNEAISPYQTLGLAATENYYFDGVVVGGFQTGTKLFNPDLKWEESATLNIGVDYGFFKNILVGSFEYYNTETSDLLIDRTTPGGTGYSSILSNIGKVQNTGLELSLTANLIRKKSLNWSIFTTWSKNRTEILDLNGEVDSLGVALDDVSRSRFIGMPIDVYYQYDYDGIWKTQEEIEGSHMPDARPGDIRVKDTNGDGIVDADDRIVIRRDPLWYGSLGTSFSFKGFDLYVEFYRVHGAKRSNNYYTGWSEGGTLQGVRNGIRRDYWTPENPDGTAPRPYASQQPAYLYAAAVHDASYTRLRTVSLSYHLPKNILSKVRLSDVTFYTTLTNMKTWTEYKSYSPELNAGGYPDGKSVLFGIKITN